MPGNRLLERFGGKLGLTVRVNKKPLRLYRQVTKSAMASTASVAVIWLEFEYPTTGLDNMSPTPT